MIAVENTLDKKSLESQVKEMYRNVALYPDAQYHFETGHSLALRLGYPDEMLNRIPAESIESFAGVGYHFELAGIKPGDRVLDLGCGSGTDLFIAAELAGPTGHVVGVDMTDEQLAKSQKLALMKRYSNVSFFKGYIEKLPFVDQEFDVIISNGVFNLSPEKQSLFSEIARVLKKGGRLAFSDIVTETLLPVSITCDASLWAACIGGATYEEELYGLLENNGFEKVQVIQNVQYEFLSNSAKGAVKKYGVKSISLCAERS